MSIEVITLEYFSAVPQAYINSSAISRQRHEAFHCFLSDNSKQDVATDCTHKTIDLISQ